MFSMTFAASATLIEDALSIRSQFSLPFWDAFNVSIFNKSFQSYDFLNEVRFHNSKTEVHKIDRDFTLDFLKARNDLEYLTFNSTVILDSKERYHVPMLDFHIPISEINKKTCIAVLKELNFSGFLLNSGKSFHFYGRKLVSESELVTLLSTALLFAPIIDRAWIAHQLIERSCCLRISIKYGHLPFKVAEI